KLDGYYSYTSVNHPEIFNSTIENCDLSMTGELKREIDYVDNKALLRFISKNANNCFHIDLSYLSQRLSYLVHIKSKFISGNPLLFYMVDNATKKGFSETYLVNNKGTFADSYFIIPSQNPYGVGYTLYVSNISFDNSKTINELQNIEVYPIPYEFIKNIRLENNIFVEPTYQNIDFEKKQLFLYKFNSIPIQNYPSNTIIGLSQSYNQGWNAWMNCQELKDHVLVNNWANGWRVPSTENLKSNNLMSNIVIIFWPQYLEFVGFGILIATGIGIVLYHPRS
ncbi:hypothetical protein HY041_01025, partial [Candidatus Roizmanbacteria bacterium]|nr:hypothetical protein [Candidatus Roizmanbacteria bacterium]